MSKRHPTATALGAWFDGESGDDLSGHVSGCPRCLRRVRELDEIRSVLRGGTLAVPGRGWQQTRRRSITVPLAPVAVAAAIALVAILTGVVSGRSTLPFTARQATARRGAPQATADSAAPPAGAAASTSTADHAEPPSAAAARSDARATPASGAAAAGHAAAPSPSVRAASSAPAAPPAPVHLATIIPASGPLAGEGAAAADAVRRAVDSANRDGGVAGLAIQLRVVAAEDRRSIAGLVGWADAVVGGFGAPPPAGVPWIAPADAAPTTPPAVAAEPSPAETGRAMAARLLTPDGRAKVGILAGPGDDGALADAFRADPSSTSVALAPGSSCDSEMFQLSRSRPAAVVLAAGPADARRCADAATRMGWDPPAGFVIAPSLVYASGASIPFSLRHTTTLLGLPWPSSSSAGAARFRAAVPGSSSYRALVSFAATELAVDVARVAHSLTTDTLTGGTFATDLLIVDHGHNTSAAVVSATNGRWEPV